MYLKGLKNGGLMNLNKEVVSHLEKDDSYSLEELFITYKTPIYQFIYRYCQDEQLSMDLVQDTFIRFIKYKHQFDASKSSIKTYLFRMAYQLMVNKLKRRKRWRKVLPFLYVQDEKQPILSEDKLSVQQAIMELPDGERAVILLTYYHDLKQKEISEVLDIPLGTVKSRLHSALKKLRNRLEVDV